METYTASEIQDAIERTFTKTSTDIIVPEKLHRNALDLAITLTNDIIAHREPIWEPGDIVEDDTGAWFRHSNNRQGWTTFDGLYLNDSRLKRPLIQRGHDNRYKGH